MEILVRRALYPLLHAGAPWHRGLIRDDGIDIVQPPSVRLPRSPAMVEVLADRNALMTLVVAALRPPPGRSLQVDLLVATHDADQLGPVSNALDEVNAAMGTAVPLLVAVPEIQAWLARKRSVEQAYGRDFCTVPEPDEKALQTDAKGELQRLLKTFGGKFNAAMQARLAEFVSEADLGRYPWSGWTEATEALRAALAERA